MQLQILLSTFLIYAFLPPSQGDYEENYVIRSIPPGYHDTLARNFWWPLQQAALGNSATRLKIINHCFAPNSTQFRAQIEVNCAILPGTDDTCSSTFLVSHEYQSIIWIFRSASRDQVANIISTVNLTSPFFEYGNVNLYVYTSFIKLWDSGLGGVLLDLLSTYPEYEVVTTGYSLGGALASIASMFVLNNHLLPASQMRHIAFSEFRVGDKAYADAFTHRVPHAYRINMRNDPAPHFGYDGFYGTEIWYNNSMAQGEEYSICDQKNYTLCSFSVPEWLYDWKDHVDLYGGKWPDVYSLCNRDVIYKEIDAINGPSTTQVPITSTTVSTNSPPNTGTPPTTTDPDIIVIPSNNIMV